MKLSEKEYREYFWYGDTFSAIPYIIEAVTEMLSDAYDMKYCDNGHWWYGKWEGHRRKVVTLGSPKGTMKTLEWGWSYDYIPHVSRSDKVTYARTEKAFRLHISDDFRFHTYFDPDKKPSGYVDLGGEYMFPSETNNKDIARRFIKNVCEINIPFIKEYFNKTQTDEETLSELERQKKDRPWLFICSNEAYVRAFILAKHGWKEEAEHIILNEYYPEGSYNKKALAILRNLDENN